MNTTMNTLQSSLMGMLLAAFAAALPAAAGDTAKAIDFKFASTDDKTLRLSDYRGKWVLVNFWAPWCNLCWREVPALNALDAREDVVVIGVAMDYGQDQATVRQAIARHGLRYEAQVLGGNRRDALAAFRQVGPVDFYPNSYLYSPAGEIVMFIPGQLKPKTVLAFMDGYRVPAGTRLARAEAGVFGRAEP